MSEEKAIETDLDLPIYSEPMREHDYTSIRVEEAFDFFELIRPLEKGRKPEKMDARIERFSLD